MSTTVPGFSSIAVANVIVIGDVSGHPQTRYFGEAALRELNLSKIIRRPFLSPYVLPRSH